MLFPTIVGMNTMTFSGIALLATGLILNWQLGLVMLACVPFIGGSVAVLSKLMSTSTQEGVDHYSKAGGVATEVSAPRARGVLVATFGAQVWIGLTTSGATLTAGDRCCCCCCCV